MTTENPYAAPVAKVGDSTSDVPGEGSSITVRHFRLLLIASTVTAIIGGCVDLALPTLIPEAFHKAQELHVSTLSMPRMLFVGGLTVVLLFMYPVSLYGLYMLRPWAPWLSLGGTTLALVLGLAAGTFAQSGLAITVSYLSAYLWGAVLILALCPPFNIHFQRHDG